MSRKPFGDPVSELDITVVPRSSRNRIEQMADGAWRAHVTAPPVDGAANEALLKYLASLLDVPRSRLRIAAGQNSRHKRIQIAEMAPETATQRLREEHTRQR